MPNWLFVSEGSMSVNAINHRWKIFSESEVSVPNMWRLCAIILKRVEKLVPQQVHCNRYYKWSRDDFRYRDDMYELYANAVTLYNWLEHFQILLSIAKSVAF